ncbi:MAG: hypothetical protein KF769_07425 [Parvibaculum sp.]|nr:hypothetical protein [Parvibaculum sp.]
MSEAPTPAVRPGDEFGTAKLVYILYFIGFVIGITAIAGVIVAYLKRGEATAAAASHLTYLIRTFWIGILFAVIGGITTFILIGVLILLATLVWLLIRLIKGFMLAMDGKPVPDPETWLW